MSTPEFSRPVQIDTLGATPRALSIGADEQERAALARRFGLERIALLSAEVALARNGDHVTATGRLSARVTQSCVASGEPVDAAVDEEFRLDFRPQPARSSEEVEVELSEGEMDVVFYEGASIDVGEAVAETLSLSLDPYPRAPDAEELLREAGVKNEEEAKVESSPFTKLRDKLSS